MNMRQIEMANFKYIYVAIDLFHEYESAECTDKSSSNQRNEWSRLMAEKLGKLVRDN